MIIQEAIALFERQKYKEAFEGFADIYNESQNIQEKQDIMSMLKEAYYAPNEQELRERYENNAAKLNAYPYFFEKNFADFSDLSFLLFPISEERYYIYDKTMDCFIGEYDGVTRHQTHYFFEHLEEALKVEDEDNLYNLTFLFDNVRRSEDVAMDNHIYLLYHTWEPLQRVMQVGDLSPVLEHEKFVFLMGKQEHGRYPIDFKTQFGIDYGSIKPHRLRIEEMKRICYWWKRGYSGSSFSLNVLNENTHIIMKEIWGFLRKTLVDGHPLFLTGVLKDVASNTKKQYTSTQLKSLFEHPKVQLCWDSYEDFWKWWKSRYPASMTVTIANFLRTYFIYLYEKEKPFANPRIVPTILFEPHLNDQTVFTPIALDFPYRTVMNCVRNPIQTAGRIYQKEKSIFLFSDYALTLHMNEKLREDYYVHRFEDLKLRPEAMSRALCRVLNIPYEDRMIESTYAEETATRNDTTGKYELKGEMVVGFDLAPLSRKVDDVLSDFDQIRLKIFYDPILRHYGYESFNFKECPMTDEDIFFMLKFPFRCEADYIASGRQNVTAQQLRQYLYKNMCALWAMAKKGEIFLPKIINPDQTLNNALE